MALIKCPECSKEISDKVRNCPHCGYQVKPKLISRILNSKKTWISLIGILIIVVILYFSYTNNFINYWSYKYAIANEQYSEAEIEYNLLLENENRMESVIKFNKEKLESYINNIDTDIDNSIDNINSLHDISEKDFDNNYTSEIQKLYEKIYEVFNKELYSLDKIESNYTKLENLIGSKNFKELKNEVLDLANSKLNYEKGEKFLKDGKFSQAIAKLDNVIPEDDNYQEAKKKNSNALSLYVDDSIKEYNVLVDQKEYIDALKYIDKSYREIYEKHHEFAEKLEIVTENELNNAYYQVENEYENILEENGSEIALDYLKDLQPYFDKIEEKYSNKFNELLNIATENHYNYLTGKFESKIDSDEFLKASKFLDEMKKIKSSNEYEDVLSNAVDKKLDSLLSKTSSSYDEIDDETEYVPKGYSTRYLNVGWSKHIMPRIYIGDSKSISFKVNFGFRTTDWVFFERIKLDLDGYVETLYIDSLYRHTQVISGDNLAESYQKYLIDNPFADYNDISLIKKIANCDEGSIRFRGDSGQRDYNISSFEKEQLRLFIDIYELFLFKESL